MESTNTVDLTIPETVTLNGVAYKVSESPELLTLVDTVRKSVSKTEKAKLYSQIAELQKEVKALGAIAPTDPNTGASTENLKKELLDEMKKTFEPLIAQVTKKTEFLEAGHVAEYRNRVLQDNQDKCYPELVVGNTKEEIDAALLKSQELWNKYQPATSSVKTAQEQKTTTTNVAPPTPPTTTSRIPAATPENDLDIKGLSMEEFAKRRQELQNKLGNLVNS